MVSNKKLCELITLWAVFFVCAVSVSYEELISYSSDFILNFFSNPSRTDISNYCRQSLLKVGNYLSAYDTLPQQKQSFVSSFAAGEEAELLSKERSRWHFRFLECLQASAETVNVPSEHPLMFCNAIVEGSKNSTAYGICLPTPCAQDTFQVIEDWRRYVEPKAGGNLKKVICTESRYKKQWYEKPLPVIDFTFNKLVMTLTACATIYSFMRSEHQRSLLLQLFLSFSIKKNYNAIVSVPKNRESAITCIFGLRFLATLWVILGHSSIFIQDFLINVDEYRQSLADNFFCQIITNCMLSVDIFFIMSATLTSLNWFRSLRKPESDPKWNSWSYWLQYYRHRAIRLWPAYLYVTTVQTFRFSESHFHEMWRLTDQGIECSKNWWKNMLFINSVTDNKCLPWTWYIGTDFIYHLLSPFFLLSFKKSQKLGLFISLIFITLSALLTLTVTVRYNFPPTQMLWKQPSIFSQDYMKHHLLLYIRPEHRIGPYIIGITLGYYLSEHRNHGCYRPNVKVMRIGWAFSTILAFTSLFGLYPALQGWEWYTYHLIYAVLHRITWSFAIVFLIYACHIGYGGIINSYLSLKPLLPLSAACYSAYLIHMTPVMAVFLKVPFPIHYKGLETLLFLCAQQTFVTFVLGFITLFIIELPAINIEKTILQGSTRRQNVDNNDVKRILNSAANTGDDSR